MIILYLIFTLVASTLASHFRGGTISWRPTGKQNEVEFTFKLGWVLGRGPGCNEAMIGKYVNNMGNTSAWYCSKGCGPSKVWLSNVNYYCTAASKAQNWEQGENSFKYTFPDRGPFTVEFTGGAWIHLDFGTGGSWNISTVVDLRVRNDTGKPNMSPVAAGKPIYSMKFGCTNTIRLPVNDQDGDKVTCRWSHDQECASVCNALPYAVIDPDTCSLTVIANHSQNGWYAAAITIEDRARQTISLNDSVIMEDDVISSVPMQFLINTPAISSRSCSDKPVFVSPTPPESQIFILTPGKTLTTSFYATSKGASITTFELTAPPGVRKSNIQTVPGRPAVYRLTVTWTPKQQNKGQHALCAEATDSFVISSDSHCLTVVAWDIDPCKSTPCQNDGTCARTGFTDNFVCTCVPGYTDARCQTDINECASDPCQNNATCFDLINEFFCGCVAGFSGAQCETDINECASDPCQNNATCFDLTNEFFCGCVAGFSGAQCETDINECASDPCQNNATCFDLINEFFCGCVAGFSGAQCETDINECASDPCQNNATCFDLINEFFCGCVAGFSGAKCETDINECASDPCQNNATCFGLTNEFFCGCIAGFTGAQCETDNNECASNPFRILPCDFSCQNNATCFNLINEFFCGCIAGFTGAQCETDINECASDPCQNNATCFDLINEFFCGCVAGFSGAQCETEINECASMKCLNGGTCEDLIDEGVCHCLPSFTGKLCQTGLDFCASHPCLNNGVCYSNVSVAHITVVYFQILEH